MTDYRVARGPWGKPWVTDDGNPLDWGPDEDRPLDKPLNGLLYDRPSDVCGYLDSKENLSPYHQAQAVLGVVTEREASLIAQFRALASEFKDPWKEAKDEVKSLLRVARMLGGEESKSGLGTAGHRFCHLRDIGGDDGSVTYPIPSMEPWLDCYEEAMERFEVLMDEVFVACDELRCAGSFDRLLRDKMTGEVIIGDIKWGAHDANYAMKPTVQTAIYSNSEIYDQETGKREPLECSLTTAALIHVPFHAGGNPRCDIYPLDIVEGWRLARMAVQIPAARKMRVGKRSRLAKAERKP